MNIRFTAMDQRLTSNLQQAILPSRIRRRAALILAHSGDSIVCYLLLLLCFYFGPPVWKTFALRLLLLISINIIPVVILKYSIQRERPQGKWGAIYRKTDPHAFPSGHAARTFVIGTASLFFASPWLGAVLLVWAALVSLARVGLALHHASDILFGALLGISLGVTGSFIL